MQIFTEEFKQFNRKVVSKVTDYLAYAVGFSITFGFIVYPWIYSLMVEAGWFG